MKKRLLGAGAVAAAAVLAAIIVSTQPSPAPLLSTHKLGYVPPPRGWVHVPCRLALAIRRHFDNRGGYPIPTYHDDGGVAPPSEWLQHDLAILVHPQTRPPFCAIPIQTAAEIAHYAALRAAVNDAGIFDASLPALVNDTTHDSTWAADDGGLPWWCDGGACPDPVDPAVIGDDADGGAP